MTVSRQDAPSPRPLWVSGLAFLQLLALGGLLVGAVSPEWHQALFHGPSTAEACQEAEHSGESPAQPTDAHAGHACALCAWSHGLLFTAPGAVAALPARPPEVLEPADNGAVAALAGPRSPGTRLIRGPPESRKA